MTVHKEIRQLINKTPVFTVANGLTLVRLALLAPIFLLIRLDNSVGQLLALFLVAMGWLTDGLDGYLARRMGQISELGRILDPLVDKIFLLFLLLFLILLRDFPPWVLLIILPRDVLILACGYYLARKRKTVAESQLWGKLTTNALTICAIAYLLRWRTIAPVLLSLALALAVLSTWSYGRLFFRKLQEAS
jgi:CDP-diacylglycerol--glycerol-3-phosphate 3-phosphatidyltransferase